MGYNFLKIEEPEDIGQIKAYTSNIFKIHARIEKTVDQILRDIRSGGDRAALKYSKKFDYSGAKSIDDIKVKQEEIKSSAAEVRKKFPRLVEALEVSCENIKKYHAAQFEKREGTWIIRPGKGKKVGQITIPLERVGVYIPGGRYIYPSSVLMTVIPAVIARVKEIVICTPPGPDGSLSKVLLYLCDKFRVKEIYKIGGAQAIAALAYGTQSIKRVDKIVGPGNIYVTAAKKKVFGDVAVDSLAGPSDIAIMADESSRSDFIAADLISQAEHDPGSRSILLTNSMELAKETVESIYRHLDLLTSEYGNEVNMSVILKSLKKNCKIICHPEEEMLINICNIIAPEHLEIMVKDTQRILRKIKNAGAIFVGEYSPVAVGDYIGGTNHVIPTNGNARFSSPLGITDFLKKSSLTAYNKSALRKERKFIEAISEFEKLFSHSESIKVRFKKK
ncbi:MAG: histidinol dehydrogenase [Actinomycetota bacterium]|nr:histidinol dehydrogenase [Actinomycetota bacterium]